MREVVLAYRWLGALLCLVLLGCLPSLAAAVEFDGSGELPGPGSGEQVLVQDPNIGNQLVWDPNLGAYLVQDPSTGSNLVWDPNTGAYLVQDPITGDYLAQDPNIGNQLVWDPNAGAYLVWDPNTGAYEYAPPIVDPVTGEVLPYAIEGQAGETLPYLGEAPTEDFVVESPDDILIWEDGQRTIYTDAYGRPLAGEWRIAGVDYVLAIDGTVLAGGGEGGSKGRLYIPAAEVDVAVNFAKDEDAQDFTDYDDSAAYVRYFLSKYYIADHSNQEFAGLPLVEVGDEAFLFTDKGIEGFTCSRTMFGHNIEVGLTDEDGKDIGTDIPLNGFIAYTCLDSWRNVQITFWERSWIASLDPASETGRLQRQDARRTPMENASSPTEQRDVAPVFLQEVALDADNSYSRLVVHTEQQFEFPDLRQWDDERKGLQVQSIPLTRIDFYPLQKQFRELLRLRAEAQG